MSEGPSPLRFSPALTLVLAMWLYASPAPGAGVAAPVPKSTQTVQTAGGGEHLGDALMADVSDTHAWKLLPGTPAIHLPKWMTLDLLMLWLATGVVGGLFLWSFRRPRLKVTGPASVLEMITIFVRDDLVYPVMGEERGEKWLPFFTTTLVFLLATNYLGIIPLFRTPTGNLTVTSALALMVLVLIFVVGVARLGIIRFFRNMYPGDVPIPIGLFVGFLEFIGILIKSMALSLRLFANMFAGHLTILSLLGLIFVFGVWIAPISLPLAIFVYALEVLIALIQAVVFTLLSCVFIAMASAPHDE